MTRGLGYREDPYSAEDLLFRDHMRLGAPQSGSADLREYVVGISNQGSASSCVAFALSRALHMAFLIDGHKDPPMPSPMLIYYAARRREHFGAPENQIPPMTDRGSFPRLAIEAVQTIGFCTWHSWPYDPSKVNEAPPFRAIRAAYDQRSLRFYRIEGMGLERIADVRAALRSKLPVVFGMNVDQAFEDHHGTDTITKLDPAKLLGGHMMTVVDVDDDDRVCIVNSWGEGWGDGGFAWLSADIFGSLLVRDVYAISAAPYYSRAA